MILTNPITTEKKETFHKQESCSGSNILVFHATLNGNYYHLPLPPLAVPLTITTVDSESRCTPIIPGKAASPSHCCLGTHLIIKAHRGDWQVPYSLGSALLPICLSERHRSTVPQEWLAPNVCLTTHTRSHGCLRISCWVVTAAALPSKGCVSSKILR